MSSCGEDSLSSWGKLHCDWWASDLTQTGGMCHGSWGASHHLHTGEVAAVGQKQQGPQQPQAGPWGGQEVPAAGLGVKPED